MPVDLFEKYGIVPKEKSKREPIDIFENEGIYMEPNKTGLSGIAYDALSGAIQAGMSIPGALMQLPTEISGAFDQLRNQPGRSLQNITTGAAELGHGLLSAPGNIRDYLVKKNIFAEHAPSLRLPESIIPKEYDYADALGREGHQEGDALLESIPGILASGPISSKAFNVAKEFPLTKGMAAKPLKQAKQLIAEREVGRIPISRDIFKEAKNFLPDSKPISKLLAKAEKGDYNSLFTLQSDLGKRGRELIRSASGAERLHGIDAHDLRTRLLDEIKSQLTKSGHEDISNLIEKGQKKYRTHMKYRKPVQRAAVATGTLLGIPSGLKYIKDILSQ